jgi:predicted Zn-dependent protease
LTRGRALVLWGTLLAAGAGRLAAAQASPAAAATGGDPAIARAERARAAGRLNEAAALYREALAARPRSVEGLWALGTIVYEQDRFAECRDVFARLAAVRPKLAPAWALRGLCEFRLGAHANARRHLERALALGLPAQDELGRVANYHEAMLLVREAAFDRAIAPLRSVLQFGPPTPELETACGLVLLRRALLPADVPAASRELVQRAGQAYCAHLARHPETALPLFEALVREYPRERYLRYGHGLTLAQQGSAEALDQFAREIDLFPDDVLARVELGFGLITRGREAEAVAPGRAAVRLAPRLFAAHLVLGRALAATGALAEAIRELETAAELAPRIPAVQLALARVYAQAGRKADAGRANAAFLALEGRGSSSVSRPAPEAP